MALPVSFRDWQNRVAQAPRLRGGIVHFARAATAGERAVGEIQAAPGGAGIGIFLIELNVASSIAMQILDASPLDNDIVVQTVEFRLGSDPLTSVVRRGDDAGAVFNAFNSWTGLTPSIYNFDPPLFVPPGRVFGMQHVTTGATLTASVGFVEYDD